MNETSSKEQATPPLASESKDVATVTVTTKPAQDPQDSTPAAHTDAGPNAAAAQAGIRQAESGTSVTKADGETYGFWLVLGGIIIVLGIIAVVKRFAG